jgi:hypothetical protein
VSTCTATRPWGRHVAPLARQVMRASAAATGHGAVADQLPRTARRARPQVPKAGPRVAFSGAAIGSAILTCVMTARRIRYATNATKIPSMEK